MAGGAVAGSNYLKTIPIAATNQFLVTVPTSATNWLVDTNTSILWVGKAIGGSNYLTTVPIAATNQFLVTVPIGATNWIQNSNNLIAMAGGAISGSNYLITVPVAATNQFLVTVPTSTTNWLVDTNTAILWSGKAVSGSNYLLTVPTAATNHFIESTVTNNLVYQNNLATNVTHYIGNGITAYFYGTNAGGAELTVTNSNSAGWSGVTAQADNGSFVTNYFGLYVNNSLFVPGSTYVGSTNDGVLEMAGRNMIFDVIGNAAHWYWLTRPATNGAMTTNFDFTSSAANFLLPLQVNGNGVITNLTISGDLGGSAAISGQSATIILTNAAGFTNDVQHIVTNTPGSITTNGATALGQVPYFTNNLNGWGWYIPSAGTGGNVFSNTQTFFQSVWLTNYLQVSNITPTTVFIYTNRVQVGTNLTAANYILDVNSGSALGVAGAGLVARFTAGASSDLIISNDTTIARLYLGHAGLSAGAAAFVVEKLSGAADGYWGESADAGGYFFRGTGGFSFGGATPSINIPSAGSGGGNIICTTNVSVIGSEQISGVLKITNGIATTANKIPNAVTVLASPMTFTNTANVAIECYFSGGTAYSVTKNGVAVYSSLAGNSYFVLQPTNQCVITYTVAPTFYTNNW